MIHSVISPCISEILTAREKLSDVMEIHFSDGVKRNIQLIFALAFSAVCMRFQRAKERAERRRKHDTDIDLKNSNERNVWRMQAWNLNAVCMYQMQQCKSGKVESKSCSTEPVVSNGRLQAYKQFHECCSSVVHDNAEWDELQPSGSPRQPAAQLKKANKHKMKHPPSISPPPASRLCMLSFTKQNTQWRKHTPEEEHLLFILKYNIIHEGSP